jgi:hypothetical protein
MTRYEALTQYVTELEWRADLAHREAQQADKVLREAIGERDALSVDEAQEEVPE